MGVKRTGTNRETVIAFVNGWQTEGQSYGDGNIFFRNNVIYSYGTHFIMAVQVSGGYYIVNGDRYSSTTSKHQSYLFREIPNERRVQIPFTALDSMFGDLIPKEYTGTNMPRLIEEIVVKDYELDRYLDSGQLDKYGNIIYTHVLGGCLFQWRKAHFLSGIDPSGTGAGRYFLSMLSDHADTLEEAYKSLMPDVVREIQEEIDVPRQGEWFFLSCPVEPTKDMIEKNFMLQSNDSARENRHVATEGVRIGSDQFVRGTIKHIWKEHKQLKLFKPGTAPRHRQWYQAFENRQVQSWSASGGID